ncbi:MAG: hypothetical protein HQL96_00705 [Magnetococcales bacterium]|nr:hypothetical protein [Magnetococcales bacterium]
MNNEGNHDAFSTMIEPGEWSFAPERLKPPREPPMLTVRKQLVTDEKHRPIAVQTNYDDWLRIEQQLKIQAPSDQASLIQEVDLSCYAGTVNLTEAP